MPRPRHQRGWLTKEGGLIYGNYRRYVTDPATGKQKKKHVVLVLGPISQMKKWEAQQKLEGIIAEDLGVSQTQQNRPDPETSFGWFVKHRYLPMREGRWHRATKEKTTFEINRYWAEYFKDRPLGEISQFELQVHLNNLAKEFSDSIVRHAFSNIRTIFRTARKMKFVTEDPAEDLLMPDTQTVERPKTQPELILKLIDAMPHPRNRALLAVGCFCGPRTSESLGLTWKSYARVPDRQRRPGLRRGCAFCRSLRIRHQAPAPTWSRQFTRRCGGTYSCPSYISSRVSGRRFSHSSELP